MEKGAIWDLLLEELINCLKIFKCPGKDQSFYLTFHGLMIPYECGQNI